MESAAQERTTLFTVVSRLENLSSTLESKIFLENMKGEGLRGLEQSTSMPVVDNLLSVIDRIKLVNKQLERVAEALSFIK